MCRIITPGWLEFSPGSYEPPEIKGLIVSLESNTMPDPQAFSFSTYYFMTTVFVMWLLHTTFIVKWYWLYKATEMFKSRNLKLCFFIYFKQLNYKLIWLIKWFLVLRRYKNAVFLLLYRYSFAIKIMHILFLHLR